MNTEIDDSIVRDAMRYRWLREGNDAKPAITLIAATAYTVSASGFFHGEIMTTEQLAFVLFLSDELLKGMWVPNMQQNEELGNYGYVWTSTSEGVRRAWLQRWHSSSPGFQLSCGKAHACRVRAVKRLPVTYTTS